jgi:membrane protease YdiL (CAAX protease family)
MSSSLTPSAEPRPRRSIREVAVRRPVLTFCLIAVGLTVGLQMTLLLAGLSVLPGKAAELLILAGLAALITAWIGGRRAVGQLFAGLLRWRIGVGRWLLLLLGMPVLSIAVGALTGTLTPAPQGWANIALVYLEFLFLIGATASLWEETAWAGFVQTRLMARHGLLRGSMLAAVPFFLIHLPLAFESNGWAGTSWNEALLDWGLLLVSLPFFRYLAGMLLVDTKGSVLAVAVMHASFNSSGAMAVVPGGWQYVPALIILTLLVAGFRALRARSAPVADSRVDAPAHAVASRPSR